MSETLPDMKYNQFFSLCDQAYRNFGSIFDLPVSIQPYEYLLKEYLQNYRGGRVLDYGCGAAKPLQEALSIGDCFYHSCDTDTSCRMTYHNIEDVPEEELYEIVAANQVMEHLSFEIAIRVTCMLAKHVSPGGILQIGVPNPQHPTRQLSNPTHITPWNYLNLCALMELAGIQPFHCVRCNKFKAPRWYERPLVNMMCRIFRMDWCDSIYVVGRRR